MKSWTKQLQLNKDKAVKNAMFAEASRLEKKKIEDERKAREEAAAAAAELKKQIGTDAA